MGDLNTLSPLDASEHEAIGLRNFISNPPTGGAAGDAARESKIRKHFERLQRKYLVHGELAYEPMQSLLDVGLTDLCHAHCSSSSGGGSSSSGSRVKRGGGGGATTGREEQEKERERCMRERCPYTEPTKLEPDTRELPPGTQAPPIRVDFMLANRPYQECTARSTTAAGRKAGEEGRVSKSSELETTKPATFVIRDNSTDFMSDHYPMRTQWPQAPSWDI